MCGFAGIASSEMPEAQLRSLAQAMTATLALRGPDGGDVLVDPGVALGHRRLSIIELSDLGAQPMRLRPGGPAIAYNGEVYNFRELRRELEAAGERFRGGSDTEVVLRAYERWGLDGLKRLEGIFAFAINDPASGRLILMRDRLGIKPLFFARRGGTLVFGSEIKALRATGLVSREHDPQALSEYLWYGNAFEDRSFYREVRSLPPGHMLVFDRGEVAIRPWWRVEEWLSASPAVSSEAQAQEAVVAALDVSVERQLVADVPVGLFLSGGLDSSSIAASAMRGRDRPLTSFSAGFDFDKGVDELPLARRVAEHLRLDHHEIRVGGGNLEDVLLALVRAFDEPFADAANIPLYIMCRELQGRIKVVLQGDGGDEMFAGYRRYKVLQHARQWQAVPGPARALARRFGKLGVRFARMADAVGGSDSAMRMALLLTTETLAAPPTRFLAPDAARALDAATDPFLAFRRAAERFAGHEPVQQMMLTDLHLQLPSQFLPKVDRATMACGIEARVPLLDETLARIVVPMPSRWKLRGRTSKYVLRRAMASRLPPAILNAPKSGFGVPYQHWLRGALYDMARGTVTSDRAVSRFGLDRVAIDKAFEEHRAGTREHGFGLWKLFQLALWADANP